MCVIAIANERLLTETEFENCFNSNDDGFGMAWVENKKHYYKKGIMELKDAWNFYEKKTKTIGFPHVCHFRIGTSGSNVPELTHPFIVSKKSKLALEYKGEEKILFHNGVVFNWENIENKLYEQSNVPIITGFKSDTRVMAIAVNSGGVDVLESIKGGKYVVFDNGELSLYGNDGWTEVNGVKFSNSSYQARTWDYYGYNYYNNKYSTKRNNNEDSWYLQAKKEIDSNSWRNDCWFCTFYNNDFNVDYIFPEDVQHLLSEDDRLKDHKKRLQKEKNKLKDLMSSTERALEDIDGHIGDIDDVITRYRENTGAKEVQDLEDRETAEISINETSLSDTSNLSEEELEYYGLKEI